MQAFTTAIDSIIFDLDGTLWDSTGTVARAWQSAADQLKILEEPITQAMVRSITGLPYDVIYPRLFPQLSAAQQQNLKQLCAVEELRYLRREGGILYPELEETLSYLKEKYPLFIVSNCQSGYIEAFLERHQLQQYFNDLECFGNTQQSKADNLRALIKRNGLQTPVYVGDTMGDYQASQSNNIPFVFTTFGFGEVDTPDARITQFSELRALF